MDGSHDDEKKGVLDKYRRRLRWTQAIVFVLGLGSCIGMGVLAYVSCSFTYRTEIVALLRQRVVGSEEPTLQLVRVGPLDATWAMAVANGALALGALFSWFFAAEELDLLARGVFPFAWPSLFFSDVPLVVGVALVSGVTLWTEIASLAVVTGLWLGVCLLGTWLNSYALRNANRENEFAWSFLVIAGLAFAWLNVHLYVEVGTQYRNGGATALMSPPIVFTVLYSALAIPLLRFYNTRTRTMAASTLVWIYAINALTVLAVSWTAVGVFATLDRPRLHDRCD